jgi:hypothetical protein
MPLLVVSLVARPPVAAITKSSSLPARSLLNTILEPSGDHVGS